MARLSPRPTNESISSTENWPETSIVKFMLWISMPSPAVAPTNSPTMAPIRAKIIAMSSPAITNGSALGSRSIQKICRSVAGERAHEAHAVLVGRAEPDHRVDEQREERDQPGVDDLRHEPEAEPDDDEGRQRDLRERLEHHDVGIEEVLHPPAHGHRGAEPEAERRADEEPQQRLDERVPEVLEIEPAGEAAPERHRHRRRRRQDVTAAPRGRARRPPRRPSSRRRRWR